MNQVILPILVKRIINTFFEQKAQKNINSEKSSEIPIIAFLIRWD